jgi:hypothetical protein
MAQRTVPAVFMHNRILVTQHSGQVRGAGSAGQRTSLEGLGRLGRSAVVLSAEMGTIYCTEEALAEKNDSLEMGVLFNITLERGESCSTLTL